LSDLILPDVGSADIVIQLGGPSMLARGGNWLTSPQCYVLGQIERAVGTRYALHVDLVGIRLGAGCACLLGCSVAELRNGLYPLADMQRRSSVRRLVAWAEAFVRGRSSIGSLVAEIESVPCSCDHLAREAARRIVDSGSGVAAASADLGMSRRHLTRRFESAFGITPRAFKRLARFSRACQGVSLAPPSSWTQVAVAAGYCDHAHLDRDFQVFAGAPPTALFSAQWYRSFVLEDQDTAERSGLSSTSRLHIDM
jgi:AraC-like DNA-binding protein